MKSLWISLAVLVTLTGCCSAQTCAVCELEPNWNLAEEDIQPIDGQVYFFQLGEGEPVTVTVSASGFDPTPAPTLHGFHVHEFSDLSEGCDSLGSHYNPDGFDHAGPTDPERHVGDLGNVVVAADGTLNAQFMDNVISLMPGTHDITGLSIVVHADEDDLGLGGEEDSLTTGHAGARLACCIITPVDCE